MGRMELNGSKGEKKNLLENLTEKKKKNKKFLLMVGVILST